MQQNNNPEIQSVFVVQNPVSGTSDPADVRTEIESHLAIDGRKYHIHQTSKGENVREIIRAAIRDGYQIIWAAGGDGTVSAVANGLVKNDIPLGIVPLGSGNLLAKELDIPLDITEACRLLTGSHRTRVLDVLQVGEDHFLLSVSVGISALMIAKTARRQKRRLGQLAYLLNGMRIVLSKSLWPFRISIDGNAFVVRASEVIAANSGLIGYKPLQLGARIRPDDGIVNLCCARVDSFPRLFSVLTGILFGQQDRLKELTCDPASKLIEIQSRRKIPVQGDGENIGYTPVRIEVIPKSLPVIVPLEKA